MKFAIGDTVRMTDHARAIFPWLSPPPEMTVTYCDDLGKCRQVSAGGHRWEINAVWLELINNMAERPEGKCNVTRK
jgi:hypothetical protein